MFEFQFKGWLTPYINDIIHKGAENQISDLDFIRREISRFISSPKRRDMLQGNRYYTGLHDILKAKRTAIGENGKISEVHNLPNERIVNNQYGKIVDQKVNYLPGKEIVFNTNNRNYSKILNDEIFNAEFDVLIQEIVEDSLNCGIGWIYAGYDNFGKLKFTRIKPWQIIPGWADEGHTKLDYAIRIYSVICFEGKNEKR